MCNYNAFLMRMIVLEGVHHRDHKYDIYVSSLECLVHPRSGKRVG